MAKWSQIARRVRVPLGFAFAVFYFWLAWPSWQSLVLGVMVILPGLLLRALASGHVRKNEVLATTGPYAYTRNPLYLGSLLIGIGFAIAGRSWWVGFVLIVMFLFIYIPVMRAEEAFLREKFPEFEDYARQVPRILPRFTTATNVTGRPLEGFSADLYVKHHEYNAVLGAAALLVALIVRMVVL